MLKISKGSSTIHEATTNLNHNYNEINDFVQVLSNEQDFTTSD